MQFSRHDDDVVVVVAFGKASAEEDAANMHVNGYVATFHLSDRRAEGIAEYLDRHRRLLLAYPRELIIET